MRRPASPPDSPWRDAAALTSALARAEQGRYLVEGERFVRQALAAGQLLAAYVVTGRDDLAAELAAGGVPVERLAPAALPQLIGTGYHTAIEAVGVARRVLLESLPIDGLLLAGESIQDPRNVGVLIRTAEAAGAAAVAFSDDSADPHSRAAVRSTTGSLLRQPLYRTATLAADLQRWQAQGGRVVATSAHATLPVWDADLTGDLVVLVGNETTGLSPTTADLADLHVTLPMAAGGASSLNVTVAAGALLFEALRQRRGTP